MPELASPITRGRSAADHLATEIATMQEGDRLGTKTELRTRLGIATATLNEAIRLLQERGLVTLRPGPKGGIFVAKVDPVDRLSRTLAPLRDQTDLVAGALEVHDSLQALAALDALRHRTADDVAALRAQQQLIEKSVNDDQFPAALRRLHELIATIGANQILQAVYRGVLAYLEANERPGSAPARPLTERRKILRNHQQLVNSIIDQDEKACRRAISAIAARSEHGDG
jgi:DNA-binding FadR family transcriptional regulator